MSLVDADTVARYRRAGWWGTSSLSERVADLARDRPQDLAFITPDLRTTWLEYHRFAQEIAQQLDSLELGAEERVAVLLPDGPHIHATLIGTIRAGLVAVGIGARAGDAEIAHLVRRTGARVLVTLADHRGRSADDLRAAMRQRGGDVVVHIILSDTGVAGVVDDRGLAERASGRPDARPLSERALGPDELFMLNSTSGTTGLPKCVTQFENRWLYFSRLAAEAGRLGTDEVFFGAVPTPFGFGLWTSHFTPVVLGAPTVVMPRFDADEMIRMIERERVTVLCCVSTQFRMLLNSPLCDTADLTSLRVMFTGGESIPYGRAVEFEERTGASLLQFFGSNETGAFSYTTVDDSRERRLKTAGRIIPQMDVRLFDEEGRDVTASGQGQPGGKGPLMCAGYYDDPEGNQELFTPDGWMLMGDVVTIDEQGYLTLIGRTSDIIIRGGKNISAVEVEGEIATHSAVDLVAVVAVPDDLFGERACAVVTLRPGMTLTLEELGHHLDGRGFSKELRPEHLVVVDEMPRSSGAKLAKGEVRRVAQLAVQERLDDSSTRT